MTDMDIVCFCRRLIKRIPLICCIYLHFLIYMEIKQGRCGIPSSEILQVSLGKDIPGRYLLK